MRLGAWGLGRGLSVSSVFKEKIRGQEGKMPMRWWNREKIIASHVKTMYKQFCFEKSIAFISTCAKVFYISFFLRTAEKPGFFLHGRRVIPGKKPGFFPGKYKKLLLRYLASFDSMIKFFSVIPAKAGIHCSRLRNIGKKRIPAFADFGVNSVERNDRLFPIRSKI
ncbi:Uncharacterized protein dnm_100660 [Desulfonema magnum]|uniref:Uncharacterized protein n=1 Tax=Desulfonema magnum TaxID=45655 RepID=A0A975GUL3_9BACT|nr:Uncharacterized protein dnm_100660 [Desulfonema magnum]